MALSLDPHTSLGVVRLAVADADRALGFYEGVLGLRQLDGADAEGALRLGVGAQAVVELVPSPDAPPPERGTTGLFHLAILVPSRLELGCAAQRLMSAGWPLSGVADHLVSEALYFEDPEGNGIEIYRDRPRSEWNYEAGVLQMATLPLDLDDLIGSADGEPDTEVAPGTKIGHVHLKVDELSSAEDFYAEVLGFDVTVRDYPRALFLSAGGYHHHIGLNTWTSRGGKAPPANARGLRWFEIVLASAAELEQAVARANARGIESHRRGDRLQLTDPSGSGVVLRVGAR